MKSTKFITLLAAVFVPASASFAQFSLTSLSIYSQDFNTIGVSSTATVPTGWRLNNSTSYSSGVTATTQAAGTTGTGVLNGSSSGGYYNFANGITGSSTDRAVGFLSTGSFTSPRYMFFGFTNNTGNTLTSLQINFDYEKYRTGTRAFDMGFNYSTDGSNWTTSAGGAQSYAADANNTTINNPPTTISKSITLTSLSIANGSSFYFMWSYTGNGGSSNGQAIGIDNFTLTPTAIPEPSTYAAIAGVLALGGVMWHRRRKARPQA